MRDRLTLGELVTLEVQSVAHTPTPTTLPTIEVVRPTQPASPPRVSPIITGTITGSAIGRWPYKPVPWPTVKPGQTIYPILPRETQ